MRQLRSHPIYLLLLVLSGEAIFVLPFVLPRIFRPTVLDVFQLDNLELGQCFSIYGITAMFSYLFGGPLADKYAPRKLIAIALWATALGGLVYAHYPELWLVQLVYGWWGFTTIFLFWSPMMKATRIWGGSDSQGKAFGFLDGGRGLTGALFGLVGVVIFADFIQAENALTTSLTEKRNAFSHVIYMASFLIMAIGIVVWFFLKSTDSEKEITAPRISFNEIKRLLRLPAIWLLMLIILCGYVGYKMTDIVSQYAEEIMGYSEVNSARVGTLLQFLRPATGIVFGLIADRLRITWLLSLGFLLTLVGALLLASGIVGQFSLVLFLLSVTTIGTGVYAVRALYFGVMRAGQIPLPLTGTAVGLISLVGYTPDVFAGLLAGVLLDAHPGQIIGYQHVFLITALFTMVGGVASFFYHRKYGRFAN